MVTAPPFRPLGRVARWVVNGIYPLATTRWGFAATGRRDTPLQPRDEAILARPQGRGAPERLTQKTGRMTEDRHALFATLRDRLAQSVEAGDAVPNPNSCPPFLDAPVPQG